MKIYTVIDSGYGDIYEVFSFKNLNDAQEFVLSFVEQESLNMYNSIISIYDEEYVLTDWKRLASKYHKSLEGYMLYKGGYGLSKIIESELW